MSNARGTKRVSDVSNTDKAAKAKIDPALAAKYGCLKTALMAGPGSSAELAKMLDAVIPLSFGARQDERHPFQTRIVGTIGDLLEKTETGLRGDISDVEKQVQEAEALKDQQTASMTTTSEELAKKQASLADAKYALADITAGFRDKRNALAQAEAQESNFAKQHETTTGKLTATQIAINEWLVPLKDSALSDEEAITKRKQLLGFLGSKDVGLDESLMTALPAALEKAHTERGPFDLLAIQELQNVLGASIVAIQKEIDDVGPNKAKLSGAVSDAQGERDGAAARLQEGAAAYRASEDEERKLIFALADSKKLLKETTNSLRKLGNALEKANGKVSKFQKGPLQAFGELRDQQCETPASGDSAALQGAGEETVQASGDGAAPQGAGEETVQESSAPDDMGVDGA